MSDEPNHQERSKLDRAFVGGVAWTSAAKWLTQLISWPSVLISARLLSPADFGLVEMAGFYFIVTNVMSEFGIGMTVLQMRELDMAVAAQLNTIALLSGVAAFGVSVAAAPWIADFFHSPQLNRLVVITSLSFILTALQSIPLALLQRDLNYRRLAIAETAQAIITALVSVSCAFAGFAYWSLIAGNLAGRTANIALTNFWCPVRFAMPRWKEVIAPLRFGSEIAVQRIIGSISFQSDGMVIGRVMGQASLGAYRMAINLASTPTDKIGALIMRVTGPLFARVQSDKDLLRRYFLIFTEALAMVIFPLVFGLTMVAPEAVHLLMGPNWDAAIAPLQWLAAFMAVRTMGYLVNQLLPALRFTRYGMWMSFVTFALMPIGFYIASRWGVGAVSATWLALSPITFTLPTIKVLRAIHCGFRQYIGSLMPALAGSAAMVLATLGVRMWPAFAGWPVAVRLAVEVAAGGAAYGCVIWGFYRDRVKRYWHFFLQLRRSREAAMEGVAGKEGMLTR